MKSLKVFLLISFMFGLCFFVFNACTNSFNNKNYLICREKLENDRQKVRKKGGYSYEAKSFEECRSPARYTFSTD